MRLAFRIFTLILIHYLLLLPASAQPNPKTGGVFPVFTLKKTPVYPQKIVLHKNVENGLQLLERKQIILKPQQDTAELVVDFGKEVVGKVFIYVKSGQNTTLKLLYGEDLKEVLRNKEYTGGWYTMPKDSFAMKAGQHTLINNGRRAFRYLRLIAPPGQPALQVDSIVASLQHYPVREDGFFSCADPQLNKIWDISAYTTKLCMQQYYEDGIKRDGLLWISDYRVQFLCNSLLFGDTELAKKCLFMIAASQRADGAIYACAGEAGGEQHPENIDYMPGIPEGVNNWVIMNYCLDYIGCLRDYYMYTGDKETLTKLWPSVVRLLPFLMKRAPEELKAGRDFITDTYYQVDGWHGSHGTLAVQYYIGINDAYYLAAELGDTKMLKQSEAFLSKQKKHILTTYYAKNSNIFFDIPSSILSTSWHVNAFAMLAGLVEKEQMKNQMDKLTNGYYLVNQPVAGYMLFWTILAKYKAGFAKEAFTDIYKYWGHMLKYNATTCWDLCDVRAGDLDHPLEFALSRCHGWSAGPAFLLPAYVLGVKPSSPGFGTVSIEPNLGTLKWAEGAIPVPQGLMHIRWEQLNGVKGEITLPGNMKGEVTLAGKKVLLQPGLNTVVF